MNKLVLDRNYEKQILAFVILQPFIDIYRIFFESSIEFLGIALSEWVNVVAFSYLCILFVIKYFKTPKYYVPLIVYGIVFLTYFLLHAWNIMKFEQSILNGADISIFKEFYFIIRVYLVPLVVFYMMLCIKIKTIQFEQVVNWLAWFISGVIVITNLLKVSFISYASTLEKNSFITRNIFEWFTNPDLENVAYMTSKGWFYMGNQIGIILFMLYPFVVMQAMKYKKVSNYLLVILQGIGMIMVSTKVATIGCILILIVLLIIGIVFGIFFKQFAFQIKDLLKCLCITLGMIVLAVNSPIVMMQQERNNAYIMGEEDLELLHEIQELKLEDDNVTKEEILNFVKIIQSHPYAYGIEKEFVELFDVEDNYMFWYKVIIGEKSERVDYRRLKAMIYEEVLKVNDNKYDRLLGIGYTSNFPYIEQDLYGQNIWFGYLGTAVLIGPYFLCILCTIVYILKNIRTHFSYQNACFAVSIGGISLLSIMAGHLFFGVFSITIFGFLVASFCTMQKEQVINQ